MRWAFGIQASLLAIAGPGWRRVRTSVGPRFVVAGPPGPRPQRRANHAFRFRLLVWYNWGMSEGRGPRGTVALAGESVMLLWQWSKSCKGLATAAAAVVAGVLLFSERPVEGARAPGSRLLPEKTLAYLSISSVPELTRRFQNTSLGRMSRDPQVQPLVADLYGTLVDLVAKFRDRIELGLPDLLSLPQGELTLALVAQEQRPPALVVLLDVGEQLPAALRFLQRGGELLEKNGVKRTESFVAGVKFTTFERAGNPPPRSASWFEKDATIVIGTSQEVLQALLANWEKPQASTLGENTKFAAIMERCRGSKADEPQVTWFVDLVALIRAVGQGNIQAQLALAILPTLGLDGLSALGGTAAFDSGLFDQVAHIYVLLDSPRSGVLDAIALEPGDPRPDRWVPGDASTYVALHWNFQRTFQTASKLYDSFRGEGALAGEINRRFLRLGLDFTTEVLPLLDNRITYAVRFDKEAASTGPGVAASIRLKDPAAMAKLLEKVYQAQQTSLAIATQGEHRYYQLKVPPPRKLEPPGTAPEEPRPALCFGILDEYLFFASRPEMFQKVVETRDHPSEGLAESLEFKLVASRIARQSRGLKPAMIRFDRPEEAMRFLFQLAQSERGREQLRRQGERGNPVARTLYQALQKNPLPPFATLERYFAPGGAMLVDEPTGLHFTAFVLARK